MSRSQNLILVAMLLCAMLAVSAAPVSATPAAQESSIFLPIIISSPAVEQLLLGSDNDCAGDPSNLTPSPATFAFGIQRIFVGAMVGSGVGLAYRFEWTVNGERQPGLDESGTITQNPESVAMTIHYGVGGACGSAIPRGVYQVSLFVNNVLHETATATIQ